MSIMSLYNFLRVEGILYPMSEDFTWALGSKEFSDITIKVEGTYVEVVCAKLYSKESQLLDIE
jgi:hypothetical protein